jgi:hemolysin activation/secretion protein
VLARSALLVAALNGVSAGSAIAVEAQPSSAASATPGAAAPATGAAPASQPQTVKAVGAVRTAEIDAFDVDGNTLLESAEIESAVYPYLGPGKTRDDVEAARSALENAYRNHGFQSVVVEVPPQVVKDGVVKLHVSETAIGKLRVVGNKYYSAKELQKEVPAFAPGTVPNINDAQTQIAEANRLPGRRVTPLLRPGAEKGTLDVDLKVSDDNPLHVSVELDNDHSQGTHDLRTTETIRDDNLIFTGNSASLTAILSPQRLANTLVIAGSDSAPIWGSPWTLITSGYYSKSNVATVGGTTVLGKGWSAGETALLELPSFGDFSEHMTLGVAFRHVFEELQFGTPPYTTSPVDYAPLSVSYGISSASPKSTFAATATVTTGLRGLGSGIGGFENTRANARPDFIHFNLDVSELYTFWHDFEIETRLSGQVSDTALVSSEQFAAGGLTSVRGYLQSEIVGDNGVLESLELRSPSVAHSLGHFMGSYIQEWRFFLFADAAQASLLDPLPSQTAYYTLASAGIGTRMWAFDHLSGQVLLADPFLTGTATKANQLYLEFSVKAEF